MAKQWLLDQKGYDALLTEINQLAAIINAENAGSALGIKPYEHTTTVDFYSNRMTILTDSLSRLYEVKENCQIISSEKSSGPMIQTGDVVELELVCGTLNKTMCVTLTNGFGKPKDGTVAVTLNSPAGLAIYGAVVNGTGSYNVNGTTYRFTVLKIVKPELTEVQGLNK